MVWISHYLILILMKTFGFWTVVFLIHSAECVRVSAEIGLKALLLSGLGDFFPRASSGRQMVYNCFLF